LDGAVPYRAYVSKNATPEISDFTLGINYYYHYFIFAIFQAVFIVYAPF
jgi:hypothetical protein